MTLHQPHRPHRARLRAVLLLSLGTLFCALTPRVQAAEAALDSYGGLLAVPGRKTGWFHLEKIRGRDLLVTPEGHAFVSLGVTHTNYFKNYPAVMKAQGHDEKTIGPDIVGNLKAWGFNTAGYGSFASMQRQIPYMQPINTLGTVSSYLPGHGEYLDVFAPDAAGQMRELAQSICREHRDNPYLIGYFFLDLAVWDLDSGARKKQPTFPAFFRGLGKTSPGKQAYVAFLRGRYNADIAAFTRAYGLKANAFDDLLASDFGGLDAALPAVRSDDELFLGVIAERYYRIYHDAVREVDGHHLIFGDRYGLDGVIDPVLKAAAPFVDVLSFQPSFRATKFDARRFDHIHQLTGKPTMICDHGFNRHGDEISTSPSGDPKVAALYLDYLQDAFKLPHFVAYHRCTYIDREAMGNVRHGLVSAQGEVFQPLAGLVQRSNAVFLEQFAASLTGHGGH